MNHFDQRLSLAVAREIQLSYLPTEPPDFAQKNFELYAELVPAYEISGDFFPANPDSVLFGVTYS